MQSIAITAVKRRGSLQHGGEQLLLGSRTLVAASPPDTLRASIMLWPASHSHVANAPHLMCLIHSMFAIEDVQSCKGAINPHVPLQNRMLTASGSQHLAPRHQVAELRASAADGLRLQLEGADAGGCRATVSFSRFVPTACDEPLGGVAAAVVPQQATLQRSLPLPASAYSSGKRLSEETRYCLERRQLEQQVRYYHTAVLVVKTVTRLDLIARSSRHMPMWTSLLMQLQPSVEAGVHPPPTPLPGTTSRTHCCMGCRAKSALGTSARNHHCWCTRGLCARHLLRNGACCTEDNFVLITFTTCMCSLTGCLPAWKDQGQDPTDCNLASEPPSSVRH